MVAALGAALVENDRPPSALGLAVDSSLPVDQVMGGRR
jgi:hypothetical protein